LSEVTLIVWLDVAGYESADLSEAIPQVMYYFYSFRLDPLLATFSRNLTTTWALRIAIFRLRFALFCRRRTEATLATCQMRQHL
jgi:hypothetical protein